MKVKDKSSKKNRRGMMLPLAVIIVIVLAIIGIGFIQLGRNARMQAVKDVLAVSARNAADAGIEHAVRSMVESWNSAASKDQWLNQWNDTEIWTDPAMPATAAKYSFGPVSLGSDTYGDANFTYKIYKAPKLNRKIGYQIESIGTAAGISKTVRAAVVLKSAFFGIGVDKDVYLSPNVNFGKVPADDPNNFTIQTNSTESGGIEIRPNTIVPGDVVCGPGGDPEQVISVHNDIQILGQQRAAEDYIVFSEVNPPAGLTEYSDLSSFIVDQDYQINDSIQINGGWSTGDKIFIGDPYAANKGTIKIYSAGSTSLNNGSEIIVNQGYSLEIYLGGDLTTNKAKITYTEVPPTTDIQIINAAKAITVKGTPDCTNITFNTHGDFYGSIYAPNASIRLQPNGDFYGAVVGGDEIRFQPSGSKGNFIYIPSLVDSSDIEVLYMGIKHGSWWED